MSAITDFDFDRELMALDFGISKPRRPKKLGYIEEPGVVALSYSRLSTLRRCPREFLLRELLKQGSNSNTIHTAYGSAFGAGVQELFRSGSLPRALVAALAAWDFETLESEYKNTVTKDFYHCAAALQIFSETEFLHISSNYELAYIDGKPGIEAFIYVRIEEQFSQQMHIDLILRNKDSGALCVAEIKTSGATHQEAMWGNAEQTAGYYTVLRYICHKYNLPFEPTIIYICHTAGKFDSPEENFGFTTFEFNCMQSKYEEFVINLMLDVQTITMYTEHKHFPKRGGSCIRYNRPCQFYGMCDFASNLDSEPGEPQYEKLDISAADHVITLQELVQLT